MTRSEYPLQAELAKLRYFHTVYGSAAAAQMTLRQRYVLKVWEAVEDGEPIPSPDEHGCPELNDLFVQACADEVGRRYAT